MARRIREEDGLIMNQVEDASKLCAITPLDARDLRHPVS